MPASQSATLHHHFHPASIEDYLQEFGRAGRDRQPSLAVLFRSPSDRKLLRYMLDKTIEQAKLASTEAANARKRVKIDAIEEMHKLANSSQSCFRDGILRGLGNTDTGRKEGVRIFV